ncbi:YcnI family protein [Streptomyces sp. SL13]|uniref:YcnI family protein n=1 Tax=Streptantibioticus silvisoli TaxID=2705255 RepID=A0AA90GZZ1_9ACTN|nr:YcnI family protein [Streptantibioticus silvisoli]MDI5967930.1 YcnI family protein [Streptantibioticus silvisoli]
MSTASLPTPARASRAARTAARRVLITGVLAAGVVMAGAGAAFAHVTVHPDTYPQGAEDGTITFRVPNEEDHADTTKVDIYFPSAQPIPSVLVSPVPGWTAKIKNVTLKTPIKTDDGDITTAVSEITWTGGRTAPGQYQDFTVAFGQLPTTGSRLVFKALQTYSDGTIVRWIDLQQSGQDEPAHPAPTLELTAAAPDGGSGAAPAPAKSRSTHPVAAKADDSAARTLGIAGLVVGVLGLIAGGLALVRSRRTAS